MERQGCSYCQNPLPGLLIRCVECPDFDFCLQCFSCGVEIGSHRKEHNYMVWHVNGFSAFELPQPWSFEEEFMLLDAVEQYGYGNWRDVSGHVETRTEEECEEHFVTFYVEGNVGRATISSDSQEKITDHSSPEGGPLSPSITDLLPPLDLSLQEQRALGYLPLRNDFDWEYDSAAENLITGLEINPNDDELDVDVKLSCISKYRLRLQERERRKSIARNHSLISTSLISNKNGKIPAAKNKFVKANREFVENMKVFTQFQTREELERLHEGFMEKKEQKAKQADLSELNEHERTALNEQHASSKTKLNGCKKRKRRVKKLRFTHRRQRKYKKIVA